MEKSVLIAEIVAQVKKLSDFLQRTDFRLPCSPLRAGGPAADAVPWLQPNSVTVSNLGSFALEKLNATIFETCSEFEVVQDVASIFRTSLLCLHPEIEQFVCQSDKRTSASRSPSAFSFRPDFFVEFHHLMLMIGLQHSHCPHFSIL